MTTYLINYADKGFKTAQDMNSASGLQAGFNKVLSFSQVDLDSDFVERNAHILNQPRGAGYWLWKPYICYKVLQSINENDIIFYSDSGATFIAPVKPIFELCNDQPLGMVTFHLDPVPNNKEILQTKRDVFIILGCDNYVTIKNTWARHAGFFCARKTAATMSFFRKYLTYCEDARLITDSPSTLGPEYPEFTNHRHDQAVYSVLTKMYNFPSFRDPSQWGNPYITELDRYKQTIYHTRRRD